VSGGEYAQAGVDYTQIQGFKDRMVAVGQRTLKFPERRDVFVEQGFAHAHGCVFHYQGPHQSYRFCQTTEGLGNKNWIAEWMYRFSGTDRTYYEWIGWDAALMAVNDLIAQGAMPVVYTDEVAAGDSEWFQDDRRARDLAEGYFRLCEEVGMAMPAGESPSLRFLVNSQPPVESCPTLSGCAVGIIAPETRLIRGGHLQRGDRIIGVTSSGLHCNGVSLVIDKALGLPDRFMTKLPNGNTLGEESLIATLSYVALIEALLEAEVIIHALVPGTGSGVAKVAFDKRPFTYRIHSWPEVPPLFLFMRECGVSLKGCLETFNWGVGYYIIVPSFEVGRTIDIGQKVGCELLEVGRVEEGQRQVIFEPEESLVLEPPGE
jgi:phosphoribosylformylglycinamidine cyclo-ligase